VNLVDEPAACVLVVRLLGERRDASVVSRERSPSEQVKLRVALESGRRSPGGNPSRGVP